MPITLVFLGKLADLAGEAQRTIAMDALDWPGLLALCEPALADAVASDKVRVAVNGEVLADKALLAAGPGAEIALLPPVSGG